MKCKPHSYALYLSKVDRAVLKIGLEKLVKQEAETCKHPLTMARALELLSNLEAIALTVTGWDAEYVLIPALDKVPVNMIEDDMYPCLRMMAKHDWRNE